VAFRIKRKEPVDDAVRRIVCEQIDKAIAEIDDTGFDPHKTVHQVRKRCKKIRGALRLVSGALKEKVYQHENAWYRESAQLLSGIRDAQTMVKTLDDLRERSADEFGRIGFMELLDRLVARRDETVATDDTLSPRLDAFRARMVEGRQRVEDWPMKGKGFETLAGGLGKTYKRGRSAMKAAFKKPRAERFHEWRKRTKYHWYHMRLLRRAWSKPIESRAVEVKALSDVLGDDHDLAVLRATLTANPDQYGGNIVVCRLEKLIDERQSELRADARLLGGRIFAEKRKALVGRMESYWDVWRDAA
jgi:CHAD domain-containing protein